MISLCSVHSRGNRKLSVRFSDFADALGTVSALIYSCVLEMNSSTTASFQVPRGEFPFSCVTSPLVGWVADCVLAAFKSQSP